MKIAHITYLPAYSAGIYTKALEKAKVSKDMELGFDFYILNPEKEIYHNYDNFKCYKISYFKNNNFSNKLLFSLNTFSNIDKIIDLDYYDSIVLRYPLINSWFGSFLNKYGDKIFTEHHTDEIRELRSVGRLVDKFRAMNEILFSKFFLKRVKGIIGVTEEIRKLELKKIHPLSKPSTVISNGISVGGINFTKFRPFDGKNLKIIFIASLFSSWHGLDKVINGLIKYKGNVNIELYLVGNLLESQKKHIKNIKSKKVSISCLGLRTKKEIDELISNMNIAISSLALYRKGMAEACPLKTREYIARGIPFVYGYKDTDLSGKEGFALKLPIIDSFLDFNQIIDFANSIKYDICYEMRQFAKEKLDWSIKLLEMRKFIIKHI